MAAKKKSKKKRTAKQIAATKKLVALNKKKGKRKASKKKASSRKASKKHIPTLAEMRGHLAKKHVAQNVTLDDGTSWKSSPKGWVATGAPKKAGKKKASKKTGKKSTPKPKTKTVTAADIMKGSFRGSSPSNLSAVWVCAGPKRTGCGGGKSKLKGSRVIGVLR